MRILPISALSSSATTANSAVPSSASEAERVLVAETFVSVQGEGKLTGVPSWFVRLSGCNLRCAWCDTPYASWRPEGSPRTVDELIAEARGSAVGHAVVTGGEPMMFAQVTELTRRLALAREQGGAGMHVTIETAGTIDRAVTCDLMSISPKLASSTPTPDSEPGRAGWAARHEARRVNVPALQGLIDRQAGRVDGVQLKFVLTAGMPEADLVEIEGLLGQLRGWRAGDVLLMPEGVSAPAKELKEFVLGACVRRGWRYCHRLHIELFGHRRGT